MLYRYYNIYLYYQHKFKNNILYIMYDILSIYISIRIEELTRIYKLINCMWIF